MNFFGLLTFNAPYLPWVLLGFSLLLGNSVSVDLLGEETAKTKDTDICCFQGWRWGTATTLWKTYFLSNQEAGGY